MLEILWNKVYMTRRVVRATCNWIRNVTMLPIAWLSFMSLKNVILPILIKNDLFKDYLKVSSSETFSLKLNECINMKINYNMKTATVIKWSHHDIGIKVRIIGVKSHHDNTNQANCWEVGVGQMKHEHPAHLNLNLNSNASQPSLFKTSTS